MNRADVEPCLSRHGFRPVDFGQLPFREQIRADSEMRVMFVPHGSASVHCGFMRDQGTVIEAFSPLYLNPSVLQLCRALGHRYTQMVAVNTFFAPSAHQQEIFVDLDHLELVLASL